MKTIKVLFATLLIAIFSGCNEVYDDSQLQSDINNLKLRVSSLEQLCKNMNENISSLQMIVTALQENDLVTSVTNLPNDAGYTISFKSGKTINIYNGSDGATPKISVRQDADGEYYWTVDGEWLIVAGKKVKAIGKDGSNGSNGITPKFKIEYGYWYVTYDEGSTWRELGKATGENGDQLFRDVNVNENHVVLTLNDGTIIKLPVASTSAVNTLRYIPDYSDGVARVNYLYTDNESGISFEPFTMDFEVFPSSALNTILQNWKECLSVVVMFNDIATKSYFSRITLEINNVSADDGILSIEINPENLKKYKEYTYGESAINFNIAVSFSFNGVIAISEYTELKLVCMNKAIIVEYTTQDMSTLSRINMEFSEYLAAKVEDTCTDGVGRLVMYVLSPVYDESVGIDLSLLRKRIGKWTSINFLTPVSVSSITFRGCENLKYVNLSNLNTSNITDMSNMFSGCKGLTKLDLTGFDTSNVTDMSNMFSGCEKLPSLDLSSFNTSKVTNMSQMFNECGELSSLDLSNFDTSNVRDISEMFAMGYTNNQDGIPKTKLSYLNLSSFKTSKVTTMDRMFANCSKLKALDLSSFDTYNVKDMSSMFANCSKLTTLDLSNFNTWNVRSMSGMFDGCTGLTSLDLSCFDTSEVEYMNSMFADCRNITYLNLNGFDMSDHLVEHYYLFYNCIGLKTLDLSNWKMGAEHSNMSIFANDTGFTPILETIIMKGCNSAAIETIRRAKPESAEIVY